MALLARRIARELWRMSRNYAGGYPPTIQKVFEKTNKYQQPNKLLGIIIG
jgi:hypothetical protein